LRKLLLECVSLGAQRKPEIKVDETAALPRRIKYAARVGNRGLALGQICAARLLPRPPVNWPHVAKTNIRV